MEAKKRIVTLIALVLVATVATAQKKPRLPIWEDRKGCVRSQGNLAAGYLFHQKQVAAYLTGDMDLFIDRRVSFNGQIWTSFATTAKDKPGVRANHSLFWGLNYHLTKKGRFDPYIGITAGAGLVRLNYHNGESIQRTPFNVVPLLSAQIGMNYYVGSIFHFFAKAQGVSGIFLPGANKGQRLEELRFTAGLGWNLRLWRPKKADNAPLPVMYKGRG